MDTKPVAPAIQLRASQEPTQNLSIEDAIGIAEDGASAVGGLLGFIMGLIHRFGHVNHPLLPDKIAEALSHAKNLQSSLSEASAAVTKTPAPVTASDTP